MPTRDKAKQAVYQNTHYTKNKEYYKERRDARFNRIRLRSDQIKASFGCLICGENDPIAVDFHHLTPSDKSHSIARLVTAGKSWLLIVSEIEKCVTLCANCHRKIHAYPEWLSKLDNASMIVLSDEHRKMI